ncbi:hypothetical protein [Streptomyces hygroscopicus]|uniref:hypothetical protein n=1 Tax=Streptomyces hygroscopicus TaxID=1912 RepID=UPI0036CE047C
MDEVEILPVAGPATLTIFVSMNRPGSIAMAREGARLADGSPAGSLGDRDRQGRRWQDGARGGALWRGAHCLGLVTDCPHSATAGLVDGG